MHLSVGNEHPSEVDKPPKQYDKRPRSAGIGHRSGDRPDLEGGRRGTIEVLGRLAAMTAAAIGGRSLCAKILVTSTPLRCKLVSMLYCDRIKYGWVPAAAACAS